MGTDQFDSEKELDVNPINTAAFSVMDESIVRKHNYCMAFIPEVEFRLCFLCMGQSDVRAGG